jgi:hypothetical protein
VAGNPTSVANRDDYDVGAVVGRLAILIAAWAAANAPRGRPPVQMQTDDTYRRLFLDEVVGEMRDSFHARADYLRTRYS